MSGSAEGVDRGADQRPSRLIVSLSAHRPVQYSCSPNEIAVVENDRTVKVDLHHLVSNAMGWMKELPGLGQQDEHAHHRAVARGLITVHHVPDHSYPLLPLVPHIQTGPSDRHRAFVIHLSRGLQFG